MKSKLNFYFDTNTLLTDLFILIRMIDANMYIESKSEFESNLIVGI